MPQFLEPAFNCCHRLRGKITDKARKRPAMWRKKREILSSKGICFAGRY